MTSDFWKAMLGATVFSVLGTVLLVYTDAPAFVGWLQIVFFGGGGLIVLVKEIYQRHKRKQIRQREASVENWIPPGAERAGVRRFFAFGKAPPTFVPTRHPLRPALTQRLQALLLDLESAGVLAPGEITLDEAIEAAEFEDDFTEMDFYSVAHILHSLNGQRGRPRLNVSFQDAEGSMNEAAIAAMIRELARLAGKQETLRVLAVTSPEGGKVIPVEEQPPEPNAKVEFEVDGRRCVVQFAMLDRHVPIGLDEGVAQHVLGPDSQKRFVSAYLDSFFLTALVDDANIAVLETRFPGEFSFLGATSQIGQARDGRL